MGKKIGFSQHLPYVSPPLQGGEILYFKYPRVSAVNRIATRTFRDNKTTTTEPILSFDLILMSTLTWITEEELQREIRNKGDQFCCYSGGEKMRNACGASGHQCENEWQRKKKEQEHIQFFLHKTCH